MGSKKYNAFIRNYLISSSLYDFVFAYAVYNVLFNMHGLSVFQISMLLAWWALISMIFEIPSGALADRWSRKKMLVIAPLIKSLCFITWFFADGNFYLYALGYLFWSIGSTFVSGTTESLLYDELVAFKKKSAYERILGKKKFWFHVSLALSTISGGFIAYYNLDMTLLFSVVPLLLSAFFALLITETPKVETCKSTHYLEYIRLAYREVKSNKILRVLFIYSLGVSIFWNLEEFDQLYYQLSGLPILYFGLVGFLWSVFNSIGAYYAHRLKQAFWVFYGLPFITIPLLFFVGLSPSLPMIGVLLLSYFLTSPLRILIDSRIQHSIKSVSRATVTSVNSFCLNFFGVVLTLLFGVISRVWNLQAVYVFASIFLLLFSVWAFVNRETFELKSR